MKISRTHHTTKAGILKKNPAKITSTDSLESHAIWKKVQDRLGITSGDVDPGLIISLENDMKRNGGFTRARYEEIITNYYTAMLEKLEKEENGRELEKTIFNMWNKA
jgi:hypothetical protein